MRGSSVALSAISCNPWDPGLFRHHVAIVGLGFAAVSAAGAILALATSMRVAALLASLAVLLIAGWGLLLYRLASAGTSIGCRSMYHLSWMDAAGPLVVLVFGAIATAVLPDLRHNSTPAA